MDDNLNADGPMFCWGCKWFDIDMGDSGYSEQTPGYPGHIRCCKGHFDYGQGDSMSRRVLRETVAKAATCRDYEHTKDYD